MHLEPLELQPAVEIMLTLLEYLILIDVDYKKRVYNLFIGV